MMLKQVTFLFCIHLLLSNNPATAQDCAWDKDTDFPLEYPPLLINKDIWISLKAIDDNGQRMVKVSEGTSVVIACTGSLLTNLGVEVAEGVCANGGLSIDDTIYSMMDLICTDRIDDATNHGIGNCGDQLLGTAAQIGFNVPGYDFYPSIDVVCFDSELDITLYTQHVVYGESVTATDGNPARPSFQDDDVFYPEFDPNDCYLTVNQDAYATNISGNADYIDLNSGIYFARGHLSPNADFLTEMEADASFYYINAIPQWQSFNGQNWAYIEGDVRDLAAAHNSDFTVTTGPWGTFHANDTDNQSLIIFICDDIGIHEIPIPEFIWKVIYEPSSGDAVTIITSNHPYLSVPPTEVCPSFDCDTLGWLSIDEGDMDKGYTYCCTVQDFYAINPNAPNYPDAGILMS